jgi:hypothetical protein
MSESRRRILFRLLLVFGIGASVSAAMSVIDVATGSLNWTPALALDLAVRVGSCVAILGLAWFAFRPTPDSRP